MTAPVSEPMIAQSTAVIEAQSMAVSQMGGQAQSAIASYFLGQLGEEDNWYDTDAITHAATSAARMLDGYSVGIARFMDGFIADSVSFITGRPFRPIGVRATTGLVGEHGIRNGVTTAGVLGRAADTYRYQRSLVDKQFIEDVKTGLAKPTELASPLDAATERLKRAAQTNMTVAGRNQATATLSAAAAKDRITGYRRVLHAELSKTGDCGMCIADTTRIYRSDHLMPMHPGCHCVPVPVTRTHDPGAVINDRDLGRFYGDAGGTSAEKLRSTRYKVDEHGEIGPVLRPHGEPIRTQEQARRDTRRVRTKTPQQKVATLRNRRDGIVRAMARVQGMQTDPAWARRLDEMAQRAADLDREIVKVGG